MLISLIKILLFVAIIAALIFGVELLMTEGEGLHLAVANWEFTLGPVQTLVAAALLLLTVWIVLKLLGLLIATLRFLAGDETAITRYFSRNRERRGFKALSEAFTALAAGEGSEAVSRASKAERLLQRPDLTNLIRAQAAEMTGDKTKAMEAYKKLLGDDRTRFVGVRGLMKQKLAEGDTDTALKLAEKAFVLKPRHAETSDTLLQLQAQKSNWKGARKTLGAKLKYGSVPRDLHKRRDAVLALADAEARIAAGDLDMANDEAIEAARLSPALVPAAAMAARAYTAMGKPRNAVKVIKTAWTAEPHPDLAAAFAAIEPSETPAARIKRFGNLLKLKPIHPESKMLLAELEIAAENFPAARKALGDLPETMPNARTLTLMAAIERGEGSDDTTVKAWLAKALTASRGPQWVCENCGHVHGGWTAICDNCDAFDTLSWKEAQKGGAVVDGTGMAMLPLIVGALEDKSEEPEPTAEPTEVEEPEADILDQTATEVEQVKEAEKVAN
ncbi:heme biosynthesis protein HemY [Fluviibacterium sp. S390]|uniref:heme biosynthesis protein HemY n=1 Tax=Fluviibacterium sp. S390 TaxID=3415139 RepID=UPI003C7CFA01